MSRRLSHESREPGGDTDALVSGLSATLNSYPPAFRGNPLNLLFLDDARPIREASAFLNLLDHPALCDERREYLLDDPANWPFPAYNISRRPDPFLLSERLYDRFDSVKDVMTTQRDVGRILAEKAKLLEPDVVALMVVDGLSYYDLPDDPENHPCFVDGATTTEVGYREVIGKPSISERLFSIGYRHQLGFTYFDTDSNTLASDLYGVFGSSQVCKIRRFDECVRMIQAEEMSRGYIQIVAPGLDGLCHRHQDQPPVKHYLSELLARYDSLVEFLCRGNRSVLACLTADHGILWREQLDGKWTAVADLHPDDSRHVRYIRGSRLRHYACVRTCMGNAYSLLKLPFTTRELKSNEWGVHGGISAWESVVPLIIRTA
ncbi:MAG: hypothetical protein HYX78_01880 [Armatimonadetes bacterium]|nr:hypothetical protein [Armatimonadota bacterium]